MNITSFQYPKRKAPSSTAMKMLKNPVVDRKNKVAENKLSENIHELEMEYEKFGANYSRERVSLKHKLRGMREELERPTHEYLEMPTVNPNERLMSPAPTIRSPRPTSRASQIFHRKTGLPVVTIEEADDEKESEDVRPKSRSHLPRSSKEDRSTDQRMNNLHKRYSLQAGSKSTIQDIQRRHLSAKSKRNSASS
ncbi:unnamed protein product [Mytilus coruscus]|uniref:Uncharacterized protein n=1 Tax=Mytilus coruscus TaxID=42192 RepID=A0A6J8CDA9_MYTCO|nr:unnamed protein product [Mytilus coruscus]